MLSTLPTFLWDFIVTFLNKTDLVACFTLSKLLSTNKPSTWRLLLYYEFVTANGIHAAYQICLIEKLDPKKWYKELKTDLLKTDEYIQILKSTFFKDATAEKSHTIPDTLVIQLMLQKCIVNGDVYYIIDILRVYRNYWKEEHQVNAGIQSEILSKCFEYDKWAYILMKQKKLKPFSCWEMCIASFYHHENYDYALWWCEKGLELKENVTFTRIFKDHEFKGAEWIHYQQLYELGLLHFPNEKHYVMLWWATYIESNLLQKLCILDNINLNITSDTNNNDCLVEVWRIKGNIYNRLKNHEKTYQCYKRAISLIKIHKQEHLTLYFAILHQLDNLPYFKDSLYYLNKIEQLSFHLTDEQVQLYINHQLFTYIALRDMSNVQNLVTKYKDIYPKITNPFLCFLHYKQDNINECIECGEQTKLGVNFQTRYLIRSYIRLQNYKRAKELLELYSTEERNNIILLEYVLFYVAIQEWENAFCFWNEVEKNVKKEHESFDFEDTYNFVESLLSSHVLKHIHTTK